MLQLKQILQLLSQALKSIRINDQEVSPVAVSLLSNTGAPLSTVLHQDAVSLDNIKIYLLLAFSNFVKLGDGTNWSALEIDSNLTIMIGKLGCEQENMYVVILYDRTMTHGLAKVKLDALVKALDKGLEGMA